MESIVNYESDDGNLKLTNKSKSKVIMVKTVVYPQVILVNCSDLLSNLYEGHTQHTVQLYFHSCLEIGATMAFSA